jgi:hypothetical protein
VLTLVRLQCGLIDPGVLPFGSLLIRPVAFVSGKRTNMYNNARAARKAVVQIWKVSQNSYTVPKSVLVALLYLPIDDARGNSVAVCGSPSGLVLHSRAPRAV